MQVVQWFGVLVLGVTFLGCPEATPPPDAGVVDGEVPAADTGVDTGVADTGVEDTGVLPEAGVVPDSGVHPDAGPLVLLQGGFETVGPAAGAGNLRLVEGGFERTGQSCNATLCVWGGIVP